MVWCLFVVRAGSWYVSQTACNLPSSRSPPISASRIAEPTDANHHTQLIRHGFKAQALFPYSLVEQTGNRNVGRLWAGHRATFSGAVDSETSIRPALPTWMHAFNFKWYKIN